MKNINLSLAIFLLTILLPLLWKGAGLVAQNVAITDDDTYNADPSAMLDVKSLSKGMLVPRVSTVQRLLISNPATGLLVFDTNQGSFYFYNGTAWANLSSGVSSGDEVWSQNGSKVQLVDSTNNVGVGTSNPQNKFIVKGDINSGSNEAIFAVVSPLGDTLLAVYPDGTRIYVNDSPDKATANKGGFAVGGFSPAKGGLTNEYLRITPDSVRIYVEDGATAKATANKGGFAVGGFSPAKAGLTNEYLRVTSDSVRVYIDPADNKGGFGVGNQSHNNNDSMYLFSDKKGFNVTFLTSAERDAINNPRLSSIIFNTTDSCLQIFLGYWESIWCTPENCIYPNFISQPTNQTLDSIGGTVEFPVTAEGSKIYYKWQESSDAGLTWKMLSDGGIAPNYYGTHSSTLVLSNIPENFYREFRCMVTNACGSELSGIATMNSLMTDNRNSTIYKTVKIGTQEWMAENLNYGTRIDGLGEQTDNSIIEKYCYNNIEDSCAVYGGLYQWAEIVQYYNGGTNSTSWNPVPVNNLQGICPVGWHIPSDIEWSTLITYLGSQDVAGGKLKEAGFSHWNNPNTSANNSSGFTALPGGLRYEDGSITTIGYGGYFWSSTEYEPSTVWGRNVYYENPAVGRYNYGKSRGFSVRCVKD